MQENWRPVVGWEGLYEVSDLGRVRSLDRIVKSGENHFFRRGRVMSASTGGARYRVVGLSKVADGVKIHRTYQVHALVLEAFIGPRPSGMVCCHNDGDPLNNSVDNLRWDTQASNILDIVKHGNHLHANKTHCKNGHPFDEANTYVHPKNGRRQCRACQKTVDDKRSERRKLQYRQRKAAS